MNIELIRKYKAEFEHGIKNKGKSLRMRGDDCPWYECDVTHAFDDPTPFKGAIVINDEYAKVRMAEADKEKVVYKICKDGKSNHLKTDDVEFESYPPDYFRIKPSWKWQDEISEDKPVICHVWDDEGGISVNSKDKNIISSVVGTAANGYIINDCVTYEEAEPITAADLHPFQRVGYYSIEDLEVLKPEWEANARNRSDFLEWMREREGN